MSVLLTRDLKERAGSILDAAKEQPQFVMRNGQIYMISPVEPENSIPKRPEGYFSESTDERRQLRAASLETPQHPRR